MPEMNNRNENMMKYYRLIGKLKECVLKADSIDEALKKGITTIAEICRTDYAVAWYKEDEGNNLRPFYWVGDRDLTDSVCKNGLGTVGKTMESGQSVRILNYSSGQDAEIDTIFAGGQVSSVVCVPLSSKSADIGCILFVKEKETFSEEDADVCDIFTLFFAMSLDEDERFMEQKERREVILSARDITRTFQNGELVSQILKGVNLDVYKGEFLVILGESGCGKSTLLNIIAGMDRATSGTFTFEGRDYSTADREELTIYRRDNIGFIFQSYNLMPNLNARQNLELIAELVDNPMDPDEALEMVGLGAKKMSYPSQLSGGQQQRISIARALIKRPRLIFADEPTAALDYTTSIEVLQVMENIVKTGTTLVMVTHNEEITRMADRVVRMRNGRTYEITINRRPVPAAELVW